LTEFHETLRSGERVLIRPLTPDDAALYPDFLSEVTGEDLRLRVFAALAHVTPEMIERLTHLDYRKAMAFVAIDESNGKLHGKLLGVVRLHDEDDGTSAEFAILVRSRLKGHGLGWLLMQHIIAYAKKKGLRTVFGEVLGENTTMLRMCAELGFQAGEENLGIRRVVLPLAEVG
jgi:acetyltransferase